MTKTTEKKILEEFRKELGESLLMSPHAPKAGDIYDTQNYPRCNNCFCTIQAIHSHRLEQFLLQVYRDALWEAVKEILEK